MSTLKPGESQPRWSEGTLPPFALGFPLPYPSQVGKISRRSRLSNVISSDTFWSHRLCRSATQGFCNQEAVRKWGWPRWIKCFQGSSRSGLNRQHNSLPQQLTSCPKLHCFQHAGDEWDVSCVCKRCRVSQWVCFSCTRLEKAGPQRTPLPCYVSEANLGF